VKVPFIPTESTSERASQPEPEALETTPEAVGAGAGAAVGAAVGAVVGPAVGAVDGVAAALGVALVDGLLVGPLAAPVDAVAGISVVGEGDEPPPALHAVHVRVAETSHPSVIRDRRRARV
jgi:hypothetical protein